MTVTAGPGDVTQELSMLAAAAAVAAAFVVGLVVTGLLRGYALRYDVVDTPNARSSHDRPTPRGGGLSIVVALSGLAAWLAAAGILPADFFLAILTGALLIGGIGFVDDHGGVPARYRFGVQSLAAIAAVALVGGLAPLPVGAAVFDLGWAGHALAVIMLVWLTNLYNFMDGIDGIAAAEAIFVAVAAALLSGVGSTHYVVLLEFGFAAACLGFLAWNWPPAKIFMGDVGSGLVGFALGLFALISAQLGILPVWTWLILAGVFIVDATVTLVRRMSRGETWYEAHRSHLYQRAARRFASHGAVTLSVTLVNLLWLLPHAALSAARPEFGWWLTVSAWAPLVVVAVVFGAGLPDDSRASR